MRVVVLNGKRYEMVKADFLSSMTSSSGTYFKVRCPKCGRGVWIHARTRMMCKVIDFCGTEFRPQWIEPDGVWCRLPDIL